MNQLIRPLLLLLIGGSLNSFGQYKIVPGNTLQTPTELYMQVKQFGEFIDRFNYKSDWKGNLITEEFARTVPRANYIAYLLNAEDSRLGSSTDSSYSILCGEFIKYIDNPSNPKTISLYSGQVKARVKVAITYNGKVQSALLEMIPDVLPDRSAKWVISSVEADFLVSNADSLVNHFIAPNSHETNFINLRKLNGLTDPSYFLTTTAAATIRFTNEVAKKHIVIQNTEKVTYYITFTGWEITVDEYNRSSNNSGWLISNIKKL